MRALRSRCGHSLSVPRHSTLASNAHVASVQLGLDDGEVVACRVDRGLSIAAGRGWDDEFCCAGQLSSSLAVVGTQSGRLAAFYPRKPRAALNPWDLADVRCAFAVVRQPVAAVTISPDEVLLGHCALPLTSLFELWRLFCPGSECLTGDVLAAAGDGRRRDFRRGGTRPHPHPRTASPAGPHRATPGQRRARRRRAAAAGGVGPAEAAHAHLSRRHRAGPAGPGRFDLDAAGAGRAGRAGGGARGCSSGGGGGGRARRARLGSVRGGVRGVPARCRALPCLLPGSDRAAGPFVSVITKP
jgi:hypothetical protein